MKKNIKKIGMTIALVACMLTLVVVMTACGSTNDGGGSKVIGGNDAGWEIRDAVQGYYIQTEFTDAEWEEARALYTMHPNYEKSCIAYNELVLRNNDYASRAATPYAYEPGQRYELTKNFRDVQIGLCFWATFYGTYTFEGNTVTLSAPERFSYMFDGGAGKPKANVVASGGFLVDDTNEYVNAFNGSIINYRHNSGHDAMTVTLDQENFTFKINVVTED